MLREILRSFPSFHPIVNFNHQEDRLMSFNFSNSNMEWADVMYDTRKFTAHVNKKLGDSHAKYAIGGYGEERYIYKRSNFFEGGADKESRSIHLGTDIWGKPYTHVMSPLDGVVHSFAINDGLGNYGTTIILTHRIGQTSFHTLYGHLSANSIKDLEEGENIEAGEVIGEFGIPAENGQWPPHLHFQVISDLQGYSGDYPGVCTKAEKDFYLENCPDPDLILRLNQYIT